MAKPKKAFRVDVKGVQDAIQRAGNVREELIRAIDSDVNRSAIDIVNGAKRDAPRKSSYMANQIGLFESSIMLRVIGGRAAYTARQEYEHASRSGFFRKNLWKERTIFRGRLSNTLRRVGR